MSPQKRDQMPLAIRSSSATTFPFDSFRTRSIFNASPLSNKEDGAEDGIRTRDPLLGKEVLYH